MSELIDKACKFEKIDLFRIYNDLEQVRKSTAKKDLDKLVDSIRKNGQQAPIGVCVSEAIQNNDDYDYHLIYGQRRMLAMEEVGYTEIMAKIYTEPKVWNQLDITVEALIENYATEPMSPKEIWDNIKELYFDYDKSVVKVQRRTGIRQADIRKAVRGHIIDTINGGKELKKHAVERAIFSEENIVDIIECCQTDLETIDLEKAIKFHDLMVPESEQTKVIQNIVKAAKEDPEGEPETWVEDGKNRAVIENIRVPFEKETLENIRQYAESLGTDLKTYIVNTVEESVHDSYIDDAE